MISPHFFSLFSSILALVWEGFFLQSIKDDPQQIKIYLFWFINLGEKDHSSFLMVPHKIPEADCAWLGLGPTSILESITANVIDQTC